MSEKTVYICDGCKEEIKAKVMVGHTQDGAFVLRNKENPYTIYDNIHICRDCLQKLYNLQQAGCEINFLE